MGSLVAIVSGNPLVPARSADLVNQFIWDVPDLLPKMNIGITANEVFALAAYLSLPGRDSSLVR